MKRGVIRDDDRGYHPGFASLHPGYELTFRCLLAKLLLFAAVTLLLTGLLAQALGSLGFGDGSRYRAQFTDVAGLLVGDDVRTSGPGVIGLARLLAGEKPD